MFIVYLILYKSCIHYMYMKDFDWLMKSPDIVVTKWYANKKVFRVQAKRPRRSQNCVNFYHVRIIVENLIWISIILQRKWNSALHCDVIDFWCLQNHCDWYIRFFFVLHFCCDEKRVLFDRYDKCFPGTFKIYLFFVQDHSRRLLTNHECTIPRFAIRDKRFVSFVFCCLNFLKEATGFTTLQK